MVGIVTHEGNIKMYIRFKLGTFYTPKDESVFFEWLKSINAIVSLRGVVRELEIEIDDKISESEFYELLGLFRRYKICYKKLRKLENDDNSSWLRSKKAYWHKKLYG